MATKKKVECVLLAQFASNLLLPRASVVHVVDSERLDIVVDLQGGILGKLQWQGWTVPLLSFEAIVNSTIPKFNRETKSVILHSLIEDSLRPYIALTVQGSPQPIEVSDDNMRLIKGKTSDFIQSRVLINTEIEAVIPELPVLVTYAAQFL